MTLKDFKSFEWTNVRWQYFATIAANIIAIAQGTTIGWSSPALPILASTDTPLQSGPLSNEEISWVGGVNYIASMIGCLTFGFGTSLLGPKRIVHFLTIPFVAFWILIYFGDMYYHILIGRFLTGWGGGGVLNVIILFVADISNDDIRGRLGSLTMFSRNVGILIAYILGASVDYMHMPIICITIPIAFGVIFATIPNTPRFYLQQGKIQKAEDALKFYKGYKGNDQQEDLAIFKEFERLKTIINDKKKCEKIQFKDFCNRIAIKGFLIGAALTTFAVLTANLTIIIYGVTTLKKTGVSIDPYKSSILLALALIFGASATTYLVEKLGRKILNLISTIGSACGLLFSALFHYLNLNGYDLSSYTWIQLISLSFVIFISAAGIVPLSFVCTIEYLPSKVRIFGLTIICCLYNLVGFISIKMYPILLDTIDLHGCFLIYGVSCLIGFFFILFVLEDTTGKTLDDVASNLKANIDRKV